MTVSAAHRLPHRRDDRDAVPARPGRSHRRRVRLHRAAAGGAAEAEGVGVHQREVRQDRGARAGPRAGVLGSAGRPRRRTRAARHHRRHLQPAIGRRDPADDPHARRPRRLPARGRAARRSPRARISTAIRERGGALPGAAARLFRGVGRSADLRHPLGRGAGRDRRRRRRSSPSWRRRAREGSHRRSGGGRAARSRGRSSRRGAGRRCSKATIRGAARAGSRSSAVRDDRIFEIKSTYILQPGPASLTEGVRQIHEIIAAVAAGSSSAR